MRTGPELLVYAVALLIAGIGWLLRSRQWIGLLHFVRPERVADRAGLARFSGNVFYVMAALFAASGSAMHFDLLDDTSLAAVSVAGFLVLTSWLLLGAQDYMKP